MAEDVKELAPIEVETPPEFPEEAFEREIVEAKTKKVASGGMNSTITTPLLSEDRSEDGAIEDDGLGFPSVDASEDNDEEVLVQSVEEEEEEEEGTRIYNEEGIDYYDVELDKRTRAALDYSKYADLLLNLILYMIMAFFTAPVAIIFFAFSLDFIVHLIFYYTMFRFLDQAWIGIIGCVFSITVFTLFLVYLEIGALKYLIGACDFRNGFRNQFKNFYDRFFILFIVTLPYYETLARKYPLLKRICDRKDEDVHMTIRKTLLWLYVIISFVASFVHSTYNQTYLIGYYSDIIYLPSMFSMVLCLVSEFHSYVTIVLKLIGVRFDGPFPRTPRAVSFEPKNSRMYKSLYFHIKRHPHPVMSVIVFIAIAILAIGYVFCSICYVIAFFGAWGQIFLFLVGQIFFIGVSCHTVHIVSMEFLSYRLFYSPYLYIKKLVTKKKKISLVFLMLFVAVLVGGTLAISATLQLVLRGNLNQNFRPPSPYVGYPICNARFHGVNVTDLALMSNLPYLLGDSFNSSFHQYFPKNNWEIIPVNSSDDFLAIVHLYNKELNLSIISTRGTHGVLDVLMDLYFYSEVVSLQILNMFFPFFTLLPEPRIGELIQYMYYITDFLFPNQKSYDLVLDNLVSSEMANETQKIPMREWRLNWQFGKLNNYLVSAMSEREESFLLTGHSLGGGVSQIVASKHNITAVTFAAPGILYSRKKFGILAPGQIFRSAVNVRAYNDPVANTDRQVGLLQWIDCHVDNMIGCHLLDNYIIELYSGCHAGEPPLVR